MGCVQCGTQNKSSDHIASELTLKHVEVSVDTFNKLDSFSGSSVPVIRRLVGEMKDIQKTGYIKQFDITINEDCMTHWSAVIVGPSETPYENVSFIVDLIFPAKYPFEPPKVTFRTPIFHPNIATNGAICLDILKPNSGTWSPLITVPTLLLSIQSLLSDPNPDDPLNIPAADMYQNDIDRFIVTARKESLLHKKSRNLNDSAYTHLQFDTNGKFVDEEEAVARAFKY